MAGNKYFLEYKMKPGQPGYTDRPLGIRPGGTGRRYNFEPKEEYGGRRVEGFTTEREMARVLATGRNSLMIAGDIRDADDIAAMNALIELATKDLREKIADLEAQLAKATKPKTRRKSSGDDNVG